MAIASVGCITSAYVGRDHERGAYGRAAGSVNALHLSAKEIRQIEILPLMDEMLIYMNALKLPEDFLSDCPRLTSLNFSKIQDNLITVIPSAFLAMSKELESVNFARFGQHVTAIHGGFMTHCTSLTSICLDSFRNVTKVGDGFMSHCWNLQEIDLSPLSNITAIPIGFLQGCSEIKSLTFNMTKARVITWRFLYGCTSLHTVIFEDMSSVTEIPDSFLWGCASLKTIDLSGFGNVTSIKSHFLAGCLSLKALDLSPFKSLLVLPSFEDPGQNGSGGFLRGCVALEKVNLESVAHLLPRSCVEGGGLKQVEKTFLIDINRLPI